MESHSRSVSGVGDGDEGGATVAAATHPPTSRRRGRPGRGNTVEGDRRPGNKRRRTTGGTTTTTTAPPPGRKRGRRRRRDVSRFEDDDDEEESGEDFERRERERRWYRGAAATRHDLLCFRRWQKSREREEAEAEGEGETGDEPPSSPTPSTAGGGDEKEQDDGGTDDDDDGDGGNDGISEGGDSEDERLRILIAAAAEEEEGQARVGGTPAAATGLDLARGDGPDLDADPDPPTWSDMFVQLAAYRSEHGDCLVPARPRCEARHADLSRWVREQRVQLSSLDDADGSEKEDEEGGGDAPAATTYSSLLRERRDALKSLGFVFDLQHDPWEERYGELVEYHREHGHVTINTNNTRLGKWLKRQRLCYKKFHTHGGNNVVGWHYIDQNRIDKLNALGIDWKLRDRTDWKTRYEELCDYRCRHGHCVVPQKYEENRGLAEWVTRMRYQHGLMMKGKHSQLNEERVRLLNEVGFQWKVGGQRRLQKKIAKEKEEGAVQV